MLEVKNNNNTKILKIQVLQDLQNTNPNFSADWQQFMN